MADIFTKQKRSQVMSNIRDRGNKATELALIGLFRQYRIKGWRRNLPILGKPDFAFRRERLLVFVDGCFWHGCPRHSRMPRLRSAYWKAKLVRNLRRDRFVSHYLRKRHWRVLRIWEHDIKANPLRCVGRVKRSLGAGESDWPKIRR